MSWIDKLLRRKSNQPGPDTSSKSVAAPISRVEPSAFKCQVEEGGTINQLAVKHLMFSLGESKAFLVTFLSPPPTLSLAGGSDGVIEVSGQLICHSPCFNAFPFKIEFGGASGGSEIRCPVCGSGYGANFGYRRIGDQWNGKIDESGFFFWFSPYTRGPNNEFVRELTIRQVQVKLVPET